MELTTIIEFLEDQTGCREVSATSDITEDLGVDGDDFDDLLRRFSSVFNVDVSGCLWYFHCGEEGGWNSIGGMFFRSPDKRVPHIKVTPIMLLDFVKKGRWDLQYPEHRLPKVRYDMLINQVLFIGVLAFLIYKLAF